MASSSQSEMPAYTRSVSSLEAHGVPIFVPSPKKPAIGVYVQDLQVVRGHHTLLDGFSFSVQAGNILELRGPNGCGKTTLLRILGGLGRPDSGQTLRIGDCHYCGHNDGVKPGFTVREQLDFWAKIHGADPTTVSEALARMELEDLAALPGRWLSAGQKRKLALARLFVAPRPIWLLDEPFSGLDTQTRTHLNRLATAHCEQGGLIIAAAHDTGFANARPLNLTASASSGVPVPSALPPSEDEPFPFACFMALVCRELRLAWTGSSGAFAPLCFFAGCTALVPLSLGPETQTLGLMAPGLIMITLALSSLLPMERLFRDDLEDGTLDILSCSGISTDMIAIATLLGHWIGTGLPLTLLAPVIWVLTLHGQPDTINIVLLSTFSASFTMFALGTITAALSIGSRRGSLLTTILALPLYWPVMIFGSAAMHNAQTGASPEQALILTSAAALFALALAPFAISACLRAALDR